MRLVIPPMAPHTWWLRNEPARLWGQPAGSPFGALGLAEPCSAWLCLDGKNGAGRTLPAFTFMASRAQFSLICGIVALSLCKNVPGHFRDFERLLNEAPRYPGGAPGPCGEDADRCAYLGWRPILRLREIWQSHELQNRGGRRGAISFRPCASSSGRCFRTAAAKSASASGKISSGCGAHPLDGRQLGEDDAISLAPEIPQLGPTRLAESQQVCDYDRYHRDDWRKDGYNRESHPAPPPFR